jgi:hypothetical protein
MIPAASIGSIDLALLAETNPGAASEIARLEDLMNRGEERPEEFLRLCQLLHDVGAVGDAEHLLRRNLDHYDGRTLYNDLFGTAKQDEFETSIHTFAWQFDVKLRLVQDQEFLLSTYQSEPGGPRTDQLALLSMPCEIQFGYVERDTIEADVGSLDDHPDAPFYDDHLVFHFNAGRWRLAKSANC